MTTLPVVRLASLKNVDRFEEHLRSLGVSLPCDRGVLTGNESPLRQPLVCGRLRIPNRIAVHPMEGWDGTTDGNPTELTIRRWKRFGRTGAGLIWGGEAVAVSHEGRANPNQLLIADHTQKGLARLRASLLEAHRTQVGGDAGVIVGLQLTHSGRFCRPNVHHRNEPRILYHHPILDPRLGLSADYPVVTDAEIESIIEDFHRAALTAANLGFDFVDIKHCHGSLRLGFKWCITTPITRNSSL